MAVGGDGAVDQLLNGGFGGDVGGDGESAGEVSGVGEGLGVDVSDGEACAFLGKA